MQTIKPITTPMTAQQELASYLADYINEELERGNEIDCFVVSNALEAFEGGAQGDMT